MKTFNLQGTSLLNACLWESISVVINMLWRKLTVFPPCIWKQKKKSGQKTNQKVNKVEKQPAAVQTLEYSNEENLQQITEGSSNLDKTMFHVSIALDNEVSNQ